MPFKMQRASHFLYVFRIAFEFFSKTEGIANFDVKVSLIFEEYDESRHKWDEFMFNELGPIDPILFHECQKHDRNKIFTQPIYRAF